MLLSRRAATLRRITAKSGGVPFAAKGGAIN